MSFDINSPFKHQITFQRLCRFPSSQVTLISFYFNTASSHDATGENRIVSTGGQLTHAESFTTQLPIFVCMCLMDTLAKWLVFLWEKAEFSRKEERELNEISVELSPFCEGEGFVNGPLVIIIIVVVSCWPSSRPHSQPKSHTAATGPGWTMNPVKVPFPSLTYRLQHIHWTMMSTRRYRPPPLDLSPQMVLLRRE